MGIAVVLISGTLTHFLLKTLNGRPSTESIQQKSDQLITNSPSTTSIKQKSDQIVAPSNKIATATDQTYAEFSDWKVRFPTSTKYTLKRNSGTGNMAAYYISIDSLAETCTTPTTPWLGIVMQYIPSDVVENGPEAGKTYGQIYGSRGTTIKGKLYVFNTMTQFCTRNKSNPAVEEAAKQLESEIKLLEAY